MEGKVGDPYLPGFNSRLNVYTDGYNVPDGSRGIEDKPARRDWDTEIENDAGSWTTPRRTILEICMIGIMNILTDKPNWRTKIKDETIRSRWHGEIKAPLRVTVEESTKLDENAIEFEETAIDNVRVVDRCADFIISELLDKADEPLGFTTVLGATTADIIKCDDLVSVQLKDKLRSLCGKLAESQPEPWWQPGEEGIIRHLIHPSLYALEFGKTKIKTTGTVSLTGPYEEGDTVVPTQTPREHYSHNLQWLPAEVSVKDGKTAFTSTINGLEFAAHPQLYDALAELLDQCLTPWSHCLAGGRDTPDRIHCRSEGETFRTPEKIPPMPRGVLTNRYGEEYDPRDDMDDQDAEDDSQEGSVDIEHSPERPYVPTSWGQDFWREHCVYNVCPGPQPYESWKTEHTPRVDLKTAYDSLQVIVKISGIDLTPDNPRYAGGNWHVEGLANEHICATAIYYYDSENIKQDSIAFRAGASMDDDIGTFSYPQSQFEGLERVFGTELTEGEAIQELVTVQTRQDRLLVFPNVFQHRVSPFELEDRTKPGHRKIIVMWLVNPQKRIISTAHVPPQQAIVTREVAIANQKRIMADRSVSSEEREGYGNVDQTYFFCEH